MFPVRGFMSEDRSLRNHTVGQGTDAFQAGDTLIGVQQNTLEGQLSPVGPFLVFPFGDDLRRLVSIQQD